MITNQERDSFIAEQLNQGVSLSDVQKALADQFGLRMTYLELRMLAADLQVDWHKQDKAPAAQEEPVPAAADEDNAALRDADGDLPGEEDEEDDAETAGLDNTEPPATSGNTIVNVSKLARPGTTLNGDVTFASGAHGEWYIDNMGRLGLALAEGSSQPDQNDIREFQIELRKALGY